MNNWIVSYSPEIPAFFGTISLPLWLEIHHLVHKKLSTLPVWKGLRLYLPPTATPNCTENNKDLSISNLWICSTT